MLTPYNTIDEQMLDELADLEMTIWWSETSPRQRQHAMADQIRRLRRLRNLCELSGSPTATTIVDRAEAMVV